MKGSRIHWRSYSAKLSITAPSKTSLPNKRGSTEFAAQVRPARSDCPRGRPPALSPGKHDAQAPRGG